MRLNLVLPILLLLIGVGSACQHVKPATKVDKDGFPTGQATPEGAACDLARSFIKHDSALFKTVCIRPFGKGKERDQYTAFMKEVTRQMEAQKRLPEAKQTGPNKMGKCFAARSLSKQGPVSYGYAVYRFQDIKFVDVGVFLHNGNKYVNRTLVIKTSDGKWHVHPMPASAPLLSAGLNEETESTKDFTTVYSIKKP